MACTKRSAQVCAPLSLKEIAPWKGTYSELAPFALYDRLYSEIGQAAVHRRHDLFLSPPEDFDGTFPEDTAFLVDATFGRGLQENNKFCNTSAA